MNLEAKGKNWHIVSFTHSGHAIANKLRKALCVIQLYKKNEHVSLSKFVEEVFFLNESSGSEGIIFIGATGIAVRTIAPFIKDKISDPPVLVIDDHGHYVISLLSGHLGGANLSAKQIAVFLKDYGYVAEPIITTATDIRGLSGLEEILSQYDVPIEANREQIKSINMHLANGGVLRIEFDPLLTNRPPIEFPIRNHTNEKRYVIGISLRVPGVWCSNPSLSHVFYSKRLVVGTGCKKGLDFHLYKTGLDEALRESGFSIESIGVISSISIKSKEACLLEASSRLRAKFICHDLDQLIAYEKQYTGSEFVKKQVGVSAVAGPSAMVISGDELSRIVYRKKGCTFAFGRLKNDLCCGDWTW